MPRPKVNPEDRKRSVQACVPCRNSKVRCDSNIPCEGCKRRGRAQSCRYNDGPYEQSHARHARRKSRSTRHESETPGSQGQSAEPNVVTNTPSLSNPRVPPQSINSPPSEDPWAPSSHTTQSRMLLSAKGEKVYIGRTAALSYLQFLRQVLKQHIGPSPFTENEFSHFMHEADSNHGEVDDLGELEPERKQALIQCYFEATSALLDLFTKDEMFEYLDLESRQYDHNNLTKSQRGNLAALNLVIAIGGQCRGADATDARFGANYFARGQQFAFEGLLCDPSLNLIRVFLLMTFYMLGACRRNAAFMYLGVASRSAMALGLHRDDQYQLLSKEECAIRLRSWKSLCVLDTLVSSILGRPGKSSSLWPDISSLAHVDEGSQLLPRLAINLSYEICSHLDTLEQSLWKGRNVEFSSAETSLQKLRQISQKMPPELRQSSYNTLSPASESDRELLIGGMLVACVYYSAVILITRPFLTSHIMIKMLSRSSKVSDPESIKRSPGERQQIADLAQVCLDSAIFMAKMTQRAMDAGLLLKNMCLLKAWMFASGLLLGFALFGDEGTTSEVEDAFQAAQSVLLHMSDLSTQARHYHELLSTFHDAIYQSRQKQVDERRRTTKKYVDQIFPLDFEQPMGQTSYLSPISGGGDPGGSFRPSPNDFDFDTLLSMSGVTVDDSISLPMLWDDFSTDLQPLPGM